MDDDPRHEPSRRISVTARHIRDVLSLWLLNRPGSASTDAPGPRLPNDEELTRMFGTRSAKPKTMVRVRTASGSAKTSPRSERNVRSSAIGILFLPPTLTPRSGRT